MAGFGIDLTACWRPRVGMVTVSLELARALVEAGPRHRWLVFAVGSRPAGLESCEVVLSPHRHEVINKLGWFPFVQGRADLDAILFPYWPQPPLARRAAPPAVVVIHDLAYRVRPQEVPWQQRMYMGSVVPAALRAAAAVVVPSMRTRDDLLAHHPLPGLAERVHAIPWGRTPLPTGGVLPTGLEPGFILAVGTVEPRKNYPRLVEAYRRLRLEHPDPPDLVVAGRTGWAYGDAMRLLSAQPGVRLLGHVDDATLGALYRDAAVLAFPSLYEGFGLPLLDAMAAGLPALIGSQGSLPELAGGAALEVDAGDPAAIARGLERMLAGADLRSSMARAGMIRAAEHTWGRTAASVLALLEAAVKTRAGSGSPVSEP